MAKVSVTLAPGARLLDVLLEGSTLDVVQEGLARRLRFDNPNARQTCGCGESFSS